MVKQVFSTILSHGYMQFFALTEGREYKQKEAKTTKTTKSINFMIRYVSISKGEVEYDWKQCNSWAGVRKFISVPNQLQVAGVQN